MLKVLDNGLRRAPAGLRLVVVSLLALVCALLVAMGLASPARAADFTVTKAEDTNDGTCDSSDCSLREAIIAANTNSSAAGTDTINIPAGTYTLTIGGAGEDNGATGDLDITQDVIIKGAGKDSTTIDGGKLDRVFQNFGRTVKLSGMTIKNGKADSGVAPQANVDEG